MQRNVICVFETRKRLPYCWKNILSKHFLKMLRQSFVTYPTIINKKVNVTGEWSFILRDCTPTYTAQTVPRTGGVKTVTVKPQESWQLLNFTLQFIRPNCNLHFSSTLGARRTCT